jgi:CRISPR-associated endonuclease Cas1
MAATKTVAQRPPLRKLEPPKPPPAVQAGTRRNVSALKPRRGVVTLYGYGVNVRVDRGHLILNDGIGPERFEARLPRVGHGLERLIVIGSDGLVSLAALRWLADQNASFVMLERDGSVLLTTGPIRPSDEKLRRAQARAGDTGAAVQIARALVQHKLAGQEQLVRERLRNARAADRIAESRTALPSAPTIATIRILEAQGALVYWSAWQNVPIMFPKKDLPRVPDHWRAFGARRSPLTGSPRRAVNPANAMLNYCYALLESEARIAAAAMGLDPGLGFLHLDAPNRDSLACDLMEPVRVQVDGYVLDWITREPLKREWFFEQRDGNCRLMAPLAVRLSETASMWRHAVAPVTEAVAQALWNSLDRRERRNSPPGTRLTQRRSHEAKGAAVPEPEPPPKPQSVCRMCGVSIEEGAHYCRECRLTLAADRMNEIAPSGWAATQGERAQALRAETQMRHGTAKRAWDPTTHPAWLNEDVYRTKVQPGLPGITVSKIASAIGISWAYASNIQKGKVRPHPRHWVKLAELVGLTADSNPNI